MRFTPMLAMLQLFLIVVVDVRGFTPMLAMLLLFLIVFVAVREIYSHAAVISYCGCGCA